MSRLIVKGLPKYFTEQKLREHFSKKGDVTDVKLMKKRNGESRRFAFIGYKSFEDAEKSARFFDKSFIDTARIDVELAKTFSDPSVPLSFKEKRRLNDEKLREQEARLVEEQERKNKKQRTNKSTIDEEIESNPKLREFMEVMKPSHQVKSWANFDVADGTGAPSTQALADELARQDGNELSTESNKPNVLQAPEGESDDEYEDFKPTDANKGEEEEEEEEEEKMISLNELPEEDNKLANDENVTDLDWLKLRRRRMKDNEPAEDPQAHEAVSKDEIKPVEVERLPERYSEEPQQSPEEITIAKISETGRLFVRNILYTSTEQEFRELFETYGPLEEVHVAIDTRTGKSKGFVYIQFFKNENAVAAYHALDKQIFQGRLLHILPAEKKKDHRLDEFDLKNLPLKKQRELKRKDQASKTQFSWNSLYMNSDAVLDSVAAKMGVSKSQLIDAQSSNSAVKQALAEAHVIGDVRKYFENKGVDLTTFDKKERDDKVILVKNFPYGTTIEEIGELFSEYGQLKRMLMPPAGTIAIVEFRDAPSARAAFQKLAYRRFGKSIIYLEKGPKDLFTREPVSDENNVISEKPDEKAVEAKVTANDIMGESKVQDDEDTIDGPTVSIFVKNLNFATTSQRLV